MRVGGLVDAGDEGGYFHGYQGLPVWRSVRGRGPGVHCSQAVRGGLLVLVVGIEPPVDLRDPVCVRLALPHRGVRKDTLEMVILDR